MQIYLLMIKRMQSYLWSNQNKFLYTLHLLLFSIFCFQLINRNIKILSNNDFETFKNIDIIVNNQECTNSSTNYSTGVFLFFFDFAFAFMPNFFMIIKKISAYGLLLRLVLSDPLRVSLMVILPHKTRNLLSWRIWKSNS